MPFAFSVGGAIFGRSCLSSVDFSAPWNQIGGAGIGWLLVVLTVFHIVERLQDTVLVRRLPYLV